MAKLSKIFEDYKTGSLKVTDSLEITVDYNHETNCIDEVLQVKIMDNRTGIGVDATSLFDGEKSGLRKYFDNILDDIDWRGIYREQKTERTYFNSVSGVLNQACNIFKNEALRSL